MSEVTPPVSNGSPKTEAAAEPLPSEVSVEDTLRIQLASETGRRLEVQKVLFETQRALAEVQQQLNALEMDRQKGELQKTTTDIWGKYKLTDKDRFLTDTRQIERGVVVAPPATKN